jgi:DNA-binding PadR family transcriptional regulator
MSRSAHPLALAVLALLFEAPMHPYRMQRLITERDKDEVINVRQRAGLYQTIRRLSRDGMIAVSRTSREKNRPARTVYRLSALGRRALQAWLRQMLSTRPREYPSSRDRYLPLLTLMTHASTGGARHRYQELTD